MNVRILFCLVLVGGISIALAAQESQPAQATNPTSTADQANEANIQLMREDIRAERKKLVAANLPLTATEATKFWPVYDQYVGELIKINDGRFALIKEYAQTRDTMTEAQADNFIKRWLGFDHDVTALRLKYVPLFEKVIPHRKTAMFFQIDGRLALMIELQLASQVPLVKP